MRTDLILATLNREQRQAVEFMGGPVLVVAGAGTGKTHMLVARISLVIALGLAPPEKILAVTFTHNAAAELRSRIKNFVGEEAAAKIRAGSFHSISLAMLRQHADKIGLSNEYFSVLDEAEQKDILYDICAQHGLVANNQESAFHSIYQNIAKWKEMGLAPQDAESQQVAPSPHLEVWKAYQRKLVELNACDYSDILLHMITLFKREEDIRRHWANQFCHILVDEFQDTSQLQYNWLKQICRDETKTFAVGDPDQSVYEWRHAYPNIIEKFMQDWPGTRLFQVRTNYRSTRQILDVANSIVESSQKYLDKSLVSCRSGGPVELKSLETQDEESRWISRQIADEIERGTPPGEIAVLTRISRLLFPIEQELARLHIPCECLPGTGFWENDDVRDAIAILRLICDPFDESAYMRIANRPPRGIGIVGIQAVLDIFRRHNCQIDIFGAIQMASEQEGLPLITRQALARDSELWQELYFMRGRYDVAAILQYALARLNYLSWRLKSSEAEARHCEARLQKLIFMGRNHIHLPFWLQEIRLEQPTNKTLDKVHLMTIHAAKGLEFDVVFTPGLEQGILPCHQSTLRPSGIHEERRIAHVAWTRAKRRLIVSWTRMRAFQAAQPSFFLKEAGLMDETTYQALIGLSQTPQRKKSYSLENGFKLRPIKRG